MLAEYGSRNGCARGFSRQRPSRMRFSRKQNPHCMGPRETRWTRRKPAVTGHANWLRFLLPIDSVARIYRGNRYT